MQTLFYVTILILTTLVWGYIFYKKDYHPQPLKVVLQSFLMGIVAMGPVFAYKYIYQNYLPNLAEYQLFRPLLDSPFLSGLTMFVVNLAALSLILFSLIGGVSLLINFFNHSVLTNIKNALREEPLGFAAVSIVLGLLIYGQTIAERVFSIPMIGTIYGTIVFLAIIEEYIKHLMVRVSDDKKIRDIDDAITLSVIVGLAFAFIETLIYAFSTGEMSIIFYRSMISIPIHLVASGIFGYFYGLAHFAKPLVQMDGGQKEYRQSLFHRVLHLKKVTVFKEEKIMEGFLAATAFHALANTLFEYGLGFLAVPIIVLGIVLVFQMYKLGQMEANLISRFLRRRKKALKPVKA